jgi:hypothetical protein
MGVTMVGVAAAEGDAAAAADFMVVEAAGEKWLRETSI